MVHAGGPPGGGPPDGVSADRAGLAGFDEALRVPLWWHAGVCAAAVLFGLELAQAFGTGGLGFVPFVLVLGALFELVVWRIGGFRVRVTNGWIIAGGGGASAPPLFSVPLDALGEPVVIQPGSPQRAQLLRRPDLRARPALRPWISGLVLLPVTDSRAPGTDGATYLLVSTRRPDALAAAVVAGSP